MTMYLCATALGDVYGWLTQQDGRVVHDVLLIKKYQREQLRCGSKQELTLNTEDAFHELQGDYLMMICMRKNEYIPTTLSKHDYSKLSSRQIDILFGTNFKINPGSSHKSEHSSDERCALISNTTSKPLFKTYDIMATRDLNTEKITVLFGNKKILFYGRTRLPTETKTV